MSSGESGHGARRTVRSSGRIGRYSASGAQNGQNWKDFLTRAGIPSDKKLCHVLAQQSVEIRTRYAAKGLDLESGLGGRIGLPWVTPVLGSGCLGGPSPDQRSKLLALPDQLVASLGLGDEHEDQASLLREFAISLLLARIPDLRSEANFNGSTDLPVETGKAKVTANCMLAAALLNQARHEALATTHRYIRDGAAIPVELADNNDYSTVGSRITPAKRFVDAALEQSHGDDDLMPSTAREILEQVTAALTPLVEERASELSGRQVDAMIEVAWLQLIEPIGLYPGWRDLMTAASLAVTTGDDDQVDDRDFVRPRLGSIDVVEELQWPLQALEAATAASWSDEDSGRRRFYDAVAETLIAQSEAEAPLAVAFVTSMDVELEMALARQGATFTVLHPYYVLHGHELLDGQRATPIWLAARVPPAEFAKAAVNGRFENLVLHWRVVTGDIQKAEAPIQIVRLVGSPLMPTAALDDLPWAANEIHPREENEIRPREEIGTDVAAHLGRNFHHHVLTCPPGCSEGRSLRRLVPAVVIDEYSGLHHILASSSGSLPDNIVRLPSGPIFRYWLSVGVQLDDALVRLVLASYVDGSTTRESEERGLTRFGVTVNRNLTPVESDVLAWEGFDSVRSSFENVTADLEHYTDHLAQESRAATFYADRRCIVATRERGGQR